MPNRINPFPQLNRVTHDPTITISGDPRKAMQPYPFGEDAFNAEIAAFWAMLEKVFAPVWNGVVNTINEWISWFNPEPGSTDPNIFTNLLNQWGVDTLNGVATILEGLLGTTVFQSLLDSIAVSMGHSGTGHTIADIETYLGLIPGPNIATPIGAGVVPGLDASKITSGAFAQSMITGLGASLSALLGASTFQLLLDAIANIMGHSGTGHTITDVGTYLGLIPGPNIATPIGASVVPGLDASKITSGAFAQSMITGLGASLSALLGTSTFNALVDSIANALGHAGTGHTLTDIGVYLGLIPGTNIATPVTASVVPALDASKITTGQFPQSQTTNLVNDLLDKLGLSAWHAKTTAGSNLVISPDFEDVTIPREESHVSVQGFTTSRYSTDQAHSGTHSWKITAEPASYDSIWLSPYIGALGTFPSGIHDPKAAIKVRPGQSFYCEAWVFPKATNGSFDSISFGGHAVDSKGVNATQYNSFVLVNPAHGVWTKMSGYITIPAGLDLWFPDVYLNPDDTNDGNIYYIDDVIIREETAAQGITNQLFGGPNVLSAVLASVVPALDATKITTGQFPQSQTTNLVSDLLAKLGINIFNASATAGSNLVISPDFSDSTILRPGPVTYSITRAHSGTQSIRVDAISGSFQDVFLEGVSSTSNTRDNFFHVRAGEKYSAEAWVYAEAANVHSWNMLWCLFVDSTGVNSDLFADLADSESPKGTWFKRVADVTVPAGYDRMVFAMSVRAANNTGDVFYWDDVAVRETGTLGALKALATGGSNLVVDPSFEDPNILRPTFDGVNNPTYSTDQAHSGTRCLKSVHVAGLDCGVALLPVSNNVMGWNTGGLVSSAQFDRVSWGQKYRVTAWVWPKSTNTGGGQALLGIFLRNSLTGANTWLEAGFTVVLGQWQQITNLFTIPLGYDQMQPYAYTSRTTNNVGDTWYWDDVDVHDATTENIVNQKATAGTNLVLDPTFEDTSIFRPPWIFNTNSTIGYSTEQKHSGSQSIKIIVNSTNEGWYSLPTNIVAWKIDAALKVQAGQNFHVESWHFSKTGNASGGDYHIYAQLDDSRGINGGAYFQLAALNIVTHGVWQHVVGDYTIPAGYDRLTILQDWQGAPAGSSYYVDDVIVREETAPQNIMAQLWGGIGSIASTLLGGNIPALDASKITTGTLATPQIPAVTKAMSPDMQAIVDAVNQALTGTTSTGAGISSLKQGMKQIPPANILINTSSATVVTQVSAGAGNKAGVSAGGQSTSWNETIAATANYTVVAITWASNAGGSAFVNRSCTIGGMAASSLGFAEDGGNGTIIEFFGLPNPPTGVQTIVIGVSNAFATFKWLGGSSVSYAGWGGTTPAVVTSGSGTALSHTVAAATNEMIVQGFMAFTGGGSGETLSAYNRTQRYNSGSMNDNISTSAAMILGDVAGAASVGFTATAGISSSWLSAAVRLQPAGATLPSICHVVRTNTGVVTPATGLSVLAGSFFATSPLNLSADLTWTTATNKVTVSVPGNYEVEIGYYFGASAFGSQAGPALYVGSGAGSPVLYKVGSAPANSRNACHTFVVPLKAGDWVVPGVFCALAPGLTGEALGVWSYMTVTLVSRSLI